ncbi:ExbD/TolR family protein [Sporomusa aerivorans]|uniref:ExbD/TolR family protein n=1 Tax=Sporomusa aerivorans TaxID=204936 RepID=UPI00352B275D
MRFGRLKIERSPKIMIIPMIDIIFFLLVFFMMSTLYMFEQNTIQVMLPQAAAGQTDQTSLVPITVTAPGKLVFKQEEISPELLIPRVQAELVRDPETAFLLRGDRQAEYGTVIRILDILKKTGIRKIAVATETGE